MDPQVRRFAIWMAILFGFIAALPYMFGVATTLPGEMYLGHQYNVDDHMVYAAWMRQAMDGHFLFDNRFAIDPQPAQTFHLYFLVLGWLAKAVGIPLASVIGRVVFSGLFVWLLARFVSRLTDCVYTAKLAIAIAVVGGGLGFLVWHNFGVLIVRPDASAFAGLMAGRLPTDVWQPEGFVFPSMLTNGLFMVSLCLIVGTFDCVVAAKASWRSAIWGAFWMLILANIHSYDALLIGLVLTAYLVAAFVSKTFETAWLHRVLTIVSGAIPSALWLIHVLQVDPVFQARAATPTFSPTFPQLLFGYGLLIGAGLIFLFKSNRLWAGACGAGIALLAFAASGATTETYWMGWAPWLVVFLVAIFLSSVLATADIGRNLVVCWGLVGLIAPFIPTLFQRKLAMGLSVPWAILGAIGIAALVIDRDRSKRNMATVLTLVLFAATGIRWIFRESQLASDNVSNTTVHPVHLTRNVVQILEYLDKQPGRKVVLALPGLNSPLIEPDRFATPYVPDLNSIVSGFTGSYTYAGHWSETPDYGNRRNETTRFFLKSSDEGSLRSDFISKAGANYAIVPVHAAFPNIANELSDVNLGQVLIAGPQFELVRLR